MPRNKIPPVVINCITGFCTFAGGDVIAQRITNPQKDVAEASSSSSFDYKRCIQTGMLGTVMNGVILTRYYTLLDRYIGGGMAVSTVVQKTVVDQIVYGPFSIVVFFGFNAIRQAGSVTEGVQLARSKIEASFWPTFVADCSVWPLFNMINFRFVPLAYRASFTSVVQLAWQSYLSWVASIKPPSSSSQLEIDTNVHPDRSEPGL
jgi:protein Mpv17